MCTVAAGTASGSARGCCTQLSTKRPSRGTCRSSSVFQSASAWQGWFIADSRFTSGFGQSASKVLKAPFLQIGGEIHAFGKGADAERVAEGGEHRDGLAHVFGGRAVHDRAVAHLDVPGAGTRRDHEGGAAEALHRRLHRGQRAQRGIQEQQPEHLAGERLRLRVRLQPRGQCQQLDDLLAAEVRKIQEARGAARRHGASSASAAASASTWRSSST